MNSIVAVDANVLVYLHDSVNKEKREIADRIVAELPCIPAQVVSEYLNVIRRLLKLPKYDLLLQTANLFENCNILPVSATVLNNAAELITKYQLQLFDAVIVSSASAAGCQTLYSEDMHHGLKIDQLTIVNPFL